MTREMLLRGIGIRNICINRFARRGKIIIRKGKRKNQRKRIRVVRGRISMRKSLRISSDDKKGR
jgi:hypothetical protein